MELQLNPYNSLCINQPSRSTRSRSTQSSSINQSIFISVLHDPSYYPSQLLQPSHVQHCTTMSLEHTFSYPLPSPVSSSSTHHPSGFPLKLQFHLFQNSYPDSPNRSPSISLRNNTHLSRYSASSDPLVTVWQNIDLPWTIIKSLNHLHLDRLDEALVNKLVPCVWLSSGTLEVWGLEKNYTQMGIWPLTSWLSVDYRIQHQTIGHPMGTHTPHTHTPHTHTRQPLHSNKICDIYNKPFEVSLGILYLMCRDPNYRWSILYCGTRTLENLLHRKLNTSNAI